MIIHIDMSVGAVSQFSWPLVANTASVTGILVNKYVTLNIQFLLRVEFSTLRYFVYIMRCSSPNVQFFQIVGSEL